MLSIAKNAVGAGVARPHSTHPAAHSDRLAALAAEHDGLDLAIAVLWAAGGHDDLMISRLKKRKLQLKDEIALAAPAAEVCRTA